MTTSFSRRKSKFLSSFFLFLIGILFIFFENPNLFSEYGFGFLSYFSFIPVLFLIRNNSLMNQWWLGCLFGAFMFILLAYNVIGISIIVFLLILFCYCVLYSILFLVLKYVDIKFLKYGWFIQWILFCGFEYVKSSFLLGFDYGLVGYTQWQYPFINKICDVIGVFGLSYIVIFASFIIYSFIQKLIDKKNIRTSRDTDNELYECKTHINYISKYEIQLKSTSIVLPVICFFLYLGIGYGVVKYGLDTKRQDFDGNSITVAAIQNYEKEQRKDMASIRNSTVSLLTLTDEALEMNKDIDLIIWPEKAVIPSLVYFKNYEGTDNESKKIVKNVHQYFNNHKKTFITGNCSSWEEDGILKTLNSALIFENSELIDSYSKKILLPVKEYIPFVSKFSNFNEKLNSLGINQFERGNDIKVFKSKDFIYSVLLGVEDRVSFYFRSNVKNGSRCIIVLSDEGKLGSVAFENLNLQKTVLHCIENGIPAVRCTNTGKTCIVSWNGEVLYSVIPLCKTYLIGQIPVIGEKYNQTIFNKTGEIAGMAFAVLSLALLIISLFTDIIKKNKRSGMQK